MLRVLFLVRNPMRSWTEELVYEAMRMWLAAAERCCGTEIMKF